MQATETAIAALHTTLEQPLLTRVGEAFTSAGYEIAIVGGSVRDALMGREASDFDFTTNAQPDATLRVLQTISRTQWETGRAFGTIGAQVDGETVEVTTYRADAYDGETRKPAVAFGDTLEADLERRDFAANAIAVRLPEGVIVDPFGGLDDIVAGVIRTPGSPERSFGDDPLRMMRAARFVSQLGWSIDAATAQAMLEQADRISIVSAERIRTEIEKLILGAHPVAGLEELVNSGLAEHVLPELPALQLTIDTEHRHKDVYRHSLTVLQQAIDLEPNGPDLVLRLAAILHDIGKPKTRKFADDGQVTFRHHDVVGAKLAKRRLQAMRFDNNTIKAVARLVELHMRFYGYGEAGWSDSAVRRYVRDAGDLLPRLHILTRADVTTRNRRKAERLEHAYDDLERRISELKQQEQLDAVRPELDGQAIMRILELPPGPLIGDAYRFLLEVRLDDGQIGEVAAEQRLREWYAERVVSETSATVEEG